MILLAGAGAVFLVSVFRARAPSRGGPSCSAAAAHLGWQAFSGASAFASDPRNPYVYATRPVDVFEIAGRLKDLAQAHPAGSSMPVQVISRQNLWPLPFYLRGCLDVAWSNGVLPTTAERPVSS
jgi:hypothetical protein